MQKSVDEELLISGKLQENMPFYANISCRCIGKYSNRMHLEFYFKKILTDGDHSYWVELKKNQLHCMRGMYALPYITQTSQARFLHIFASTGNSKSTIAEKSHVIHFNIMTSSFGALIFFYSLPHGNHGNRTSTQI